MNGARDLLRVEGLRIEVAGATGAPALVDDFDLGIEAGRTLGIVGETGAGKSLSMRACVGLLPVGIAPISGRVTFRGRASEVRSAKSARANLGKGICLLMQNGRSALNPFMRVSAQIERALKYRGVSRRLRSARVEELLGSVGLPASEFARRYPHELSGGQAQRVAMVVALATDPDVLIADEPTTALDATTERDVVDLLKSLCAARGMALILISHNLNLVANVCDSIVIMHAGHIVENASTHSIFAEPRHPYTKALLDAIPDVDFPRTLKALDGGAGGTTKPRLGCRFADRCEAATDVCRTQTPSLARKFGHSVRCFLVADADGDARAAAELRAR